MKLDIEVIHHIGLVVSDLAAAERFYTGILGLPRHHARPFWFVLNGTSTLHLIPKRDATVVEPPHHAYRHVALQVTDLRAVLAVLLAAGQRVFQANFAGNERDVESVEAPLDFGVGTLFVRDPDGNLVEFLQHGHGLFTADMRPRMPE